MNLPSGLTNEVKPVETLARFLRSSSHVAKSTGRIKAAGFLPAPDDDTSIFRVTGVEDSEIKKLGLEHVPQSAKHGAALVTARTVLEEDLKIVPHEPPARHANIRGWPTALDAQLQKNQRRLKAAAIAENATWLSP